jgi:glycylpeptide N-tetradecanoyltransferase
MTKKDLSVVFKLWNKQQEKYKLRYKLSQEELMHWLLPKENVVWTWVIENMVDGKVQVTDFFSMHVLG